MKRLVFLGVALALILVIGYNIKFSETSRIDPETEIRKIERNYGAQLSALLQKAQKLPLVSSGRKEGEPLFSEPENLFSDESIVRASVKSGGVEWPVKTFGDSRGLGFQASFVTIGDVTLTPAWLVRDNTKIYWKYERKVEVDGRLCVITLITLANGVEGIPRNPKLQNR